MQKQRSYKFLRIVLMAIFVFLAIYSYYQNERSNSLVYCIGLFILGTSFGYKKDDKKEK